MEGIVRDILVEDPVPDLFFGPIRKRAYFDKMELLVPPDNRSLGAIRRLVSTDGACPCEFSYRDSLEHTELSVAAATARIRLINRSAMELLIVDDGQLGSHQLNFDSITLGDLVTKFERFRKLVSSIEIEDMAFWIDPREHFENDHPLRAKSRRHGKAISVASQRPGENRFWLGLLKGIAEFLQLG